MLAEETAALLKGSIEEGIKDFLPKAHIQDLAALSSLLNAWYFLENPNLLDAVEAVFPSLEAQYEEDE